MNSKNFRKLECVGKIFLGIMVFLFLVIILRTSTKLIFIDKLQMHAPWIDTLFFDRPDYTVTPQELEKENLSRFGEVKVDVDWAALYPFKSTEINTQIPVESLASKENRIDVYTKKIEKLKHKVSTAFRTMIPGYDTITLCASRIEKWIGWNIPQYSEYNPVMELEDNYFISPQSVHDKMAGIEALAGFNEYCQTQNTQMLFVLPPSKVDQVHDRVISGNVDFSNQNNDFLAEQLHNKNIQYIDLRESMRDNDLSTRDLFFQTDHHWKPETGLWSASIIAEYLNDNMQFDLNTDLLAPEQYDKTVLKDWLLGSLGKKVTLARAKPEDISIFQPRYETLLTMNIPSMGINKTGDFSIIYDPKPVEKKDLMKEDPYSTYAYCNKGLVQIKNHKKSDKNVLVIKDSFANVVTPFLAQTVSELNILDLRIFTGSVETFIEDTKPDVVIILYSCALPDRVNLDSHKNMFDFR